MRDLLLFMFVFAHNDPFIEYIVKARLVGYFPVDPNPLDPRDVIERSSTARS